MNPVSLTRLIKQQALSLGFNAVGITFPQIKNLDTEALKTYLTSQYQGKMNYLNENIPQRNNIKLLYPEAKSIIMVLASYIPPIKSNNSQYKIAYYTYSNDYHFVVKSKLKELLNFIKEKEPNADGLIFCDSLPIFEKSYAVSAGLGWIGKNGLLINKKLGSFTVIGGIVINQELIPDEPCYFNCPPNCTRCIDACPTKAFVKPYVLNASQCVSYLTVENNEATFPIANPTTYIAGCDICQMVCPFNYNVDKNNNNLFKPQNHVYWSDYEWDTLTSSEYKKHLKTTSLARIGIKRLRRNINAVNKSI
ncbi:MAG: tRNA epoxyqueuosine(34) reductase QueG [Bacteroidales bacterium]